MVVADHTRTAIGARRLSLPPFASGVIRPSDGAFQEASPRGFRQANTTVHPIATADDGQTIDRTAAQVYGGHTVEEHETGNGCQARTVADGIPIQAQLTATARTSRLGASQVPHMHLREWLFLAWTPGGFAINGFQFIVLQDTADEPRVLGAEDTEESGA